MKILQFDVKIRPHNFDPISDMKLLELIGRSCYKSEDKITDDSYKSFLKGLVLKGHESILEHISVSADIVTDRGVTHEAVRHRLCSFTQTSTRYCNYANSKFGNEISVLDQQCFDVNEPLKTVVFPGFSTSDLNYGTNFEYLYNKHYEFIDSQVFKPVEFKANSFDIWLISCLFSDWAYNVLINVFDKKPEQARSVLPTGLATELWITANLREWRHILKLRCIGTNGKPHPDISKIMKCVLFQLFEWYPPIFEDLYNQLMDKEENIN